MLYNTTALNNLTNLYQTTAAVNDSLTNGSLAILILLVLGLSTMIGLKKYNWAVSFSASGFITAFIASILFALQMISMGVLGVTLAYMAIGIVMLIFK